MAQYNALYDSCKHIERDAQVATIDENIATALGLQYRVVPVFERSIFEHKFTQYASLQRNKLLRCRWRGYVDTVAERVYKPFTFPDIRDYHFYKGDIRYQPSESVFRTVDFKKKLKPGPGVDYRGQIPIPQELHMQRGKIDSGKDGRRKMSAKSNKNGGIGK